MTTPEMLRECLQTATVAFGSVFLVLGAFFVLINLLNKLKDPVSEEENGRKL